MTQTDQIPPTASSPIEQALTDLSSSILRLATLADKLPELFSNVLRPEVEGKQPLTYTGLTEESNLFMRLRKMYIDIENTKEIIDCLIERNEL